MEIQQLTENGVRVIVLDGRLDELVVGEVERAFVQVIQGGADRVVVDLSAVEYISSSGLRVLLMLSKALAKTERRLALCGLSPFVAEVFEVSNFAAVFEIAGTREAALRMIGAG